MNVGVALMLWSDASERLALITAKVEFRFMQASRSAVLSFASEAIAMTPLQLRQFWSLKILVYMSQYRFCSPAQRAAAAAGIALE